MTPQPAQDGSSAVGTNPWLVATAVMLATFMEVLDTSIAAVALPYIAGSLSAANDEATRVLTSYLVANAIVLPVSSWFALRFGRKRFLIVCIAIFTISSFACGSATSLAWILMARAVQGAGGGALQPLSQAILLESFPPQKRGLAMAAFALGVVVAPVLGPTLGGWLTDVHSWRWAFYINIPVGIFAVFMISRLCGGSFLCEKGPPRPAGCHRTWVARHLVGLPANVSFVVFLIREFRHSQPLVNLRVFRHRNFCPGMPADWPVWCLNLRSGHAVAALLSGAHGLHNAGGGLGCESARRRGHSCHAYHWLLNRKNG
jgi:MFS transporter, DHA2 family, multidrug resistance protein